MNNQEHLIKNFELPFNNFSEPVAWSDGVGFSVIEDYKDGYQSLYKFGVFDKKPTENLKKLYVTVSYGKKTDGGVSLGVGKKGIWDPLDLDFHNEFSYDENQNKIFFKNKEIGGKDLLLFIEELHKKPTRVIKGLPIRIKLWFWRKMLPLFLKILDKVLTFLLWLISGEKIKEDILGRYFSEKRQEESNKKIEEIEFVKGKTMEFFGYHAKRWSVVFYCTLHLAIYFFAFYLPGYSNLLAHKIGNNNFLSVCYVVVSFAITEFLIPQIIKNFIKMTPKFFVKIAFKTIRVK